MAVTLACQISLVANIRGLVDGYDKGEVGYGAIIEAATSHVTFGPNLHRGRGQTPSYRQNRREEQNRCSL